MSQATFQSPIGSIFVSAGPSALTGLRIGIGHQEDEPGALLREALAQLSAWFDGRLTRFDLPLTLLVSPRGEAHRTAICDIPYGETASYGQIAREIASSPRAVGQACRRNPFPIIVPCHRVLAAGNAIGHYTGGEGIKTKYWLLNHERKKV